MFRGWRRCALLLAAVLGVAVLAAPAAQAAATSFTAYPALAALPSDGNYTVTADGQSVPVSTYAETTFARMAYTGTAQIVVTYSAPITSYVLSPKSSGIAATVSGNTLTFNLPAGKKYVLSKVNGATTRLALFADTPESGAPVQGAAGVFTPTANGSAALQTAIDSAAGYSGGGTVYVPAGDDVLVTPVDLKNDVKLYLAPGAILDLKPTSWMDTGVIHIVDTSNVKIFGRGTILGGTTTYPTKVIGHHSDHLTVNDIMMVAGKTTMFRLGNTADSTVNNVKIIVGANGVLADGLDFDGAFGVTVSNNYVQSSDDNFAIGSGTDAFDYDRPINTDGLVIQGNIQVQTTSGTSLKFTTHIPNQYLRNVDINGNTIVTAQHGPAIYAHDGYATVSGVTVRHNHYEELTGNTYDIMTLDTSSWGSCANGHFTTASGTIRNLVFDDNWVLNKPPNPLRLQGRSSTQYVDSVVFNNQHFDGVLVTNATQANATTTNGTYVTHVSYGTASSAGMAVGLPADPNMIPPQQVPDVNGCSETIQTPQPDPTFTRQSEFPPLAASY